MKLKDTKIRAKKEGTKPIRMADGRGLSLLIRPSGSRSWQLGYTRSNGKSATATLGTYPEVSLKEARDLAEKTRAQLRTGLDPITEKRRGRAEGEPIDLFKKITEDFLAKRTNWSDGHMERFRNRMEKDVWPRIGSLPVGDIQAIDVMSAIQPILDRGKVNTAKRVVGMIGQVMSYAVVIGLAPINPAQGLSGALDDTPPTVHRAAVTNDHETLAKILDDIWSWEGGSMAQSILKMCVLIFARPGEIRHMRWSEIDGDLWRYKVSKTGVTQIVPLSGQALEVIESVRSFNGHREFVFANVMTGKPLSDVMPMRLLEKLGWHDVQSAHGFRAVARTELIEVLDYDTKIVEFQLSHRSSEVHAGAYDRVKMVDKRRVMMQDWADWLSSLRHSARAKRIGITAVG